MSASVASWARSKPVAAENLENVSLTAAIPLTGTQPPTLLYSSTFLILPGDSAGLAWAKAGARNRHKQATMAAPGVFAFPILIGGLRGAAIGGGRLRRHPGS